MVEHQPVELGVAGSSPVDHPDFKIEAYYAKIDWNKNLLLTLLFWQKPNGK